MSSSRHSSVSPTKSRGINTTPLQLKSDNIKRSRSTSPLKQQYSYDNENSLINIPSKSSYISPNRSPLRNSIQSPFTQFKKKSNFTIYQDDTDYRASLITAQTPKRASESHDACLLTPEQDDKENALSHKKAPIRQQSEQQRRIPLCDLDIRQFPGFVQSATNNIILQPRFQLTESYKPELTKYLSLPSFVTPPRRRITNIKYEFKCTKKNLTSSLRKTSSFDNRISKPFVTNHTKDEKFKIFRDNDSNNNLLAKAQF